MKNVLTSIWRFYADGFRGMTIGRTLWLVIFIKIVVIFFVIKLFFFPDRLATEYSDDAARAAAVRESMIDRQH